MSIEEVVISTGSNWILDLLREFGPTIAVLAYFMVKDWTNSKDDKELQGKLSDRLERNTEVLSKLDTTIAILCEKVGGV